MHSVASRAAARARAVGANARRRPSGRGSRARAGRRPPAARRRAPRRRRRRRRRQARAAAARSPCAGARPRSLSLSFFAPTSSAPSMPRMRSSRANETSSSRPTLPTSRRIAARLFASAARLSALAASLPRELAVGRALAALERLDARAPPAAPRFFAAGASDDARWFERVAVAARRGGAVGRGRRRERTAPREREAVLHRASRSSSSATMRSRGVARSSSWSPRLELLEEALAARRARGDGSAVLHADVEVAPRALRLLQRADERHRARRTRRACCRRRAAARARRSCAARSR